MSQHACGGLKADHQIFFSSFRIRSGACRNLALLVDVTVLKLKALGLEIECCALREQLPQDVDRSRPDFRSPDKRRCTSGGGAGRSLISLAFIALTRMARVLLVC